MLILFAIQIALFGTSLKQQTFELEQNLSNSDISRFFNIFNPWICPPTFRQRVLLDGLSGGLKCGAILLSFLPIASPVQKVHPKIFRSGRLHPKVHQEPCVSYRLLCTLKLHFVNNLDSQLY